MNTETLGRDLAHLFDEGVPQVTLDEVWGRPVEPTNRPAGRPSLVVMVSVFAAVAAGGLLIGLLTRFSAPEPGTVAPPDPGVGASTSVASDPATTVVADTRASCPVTGPGINAFSPPSQDPGGPPDFVNTVWYGTPELWTFVNPVGQVWDGLPVALDGTLTQKTFWWSERFAIGDPSLPDIAVTMRRAGTDTPVEDVQDRPTTGSNPSIGSFMLVGLNIPEGGCWEVSASYEGASLSYVVWVEPAE